MKTNFFKPNWKAINKAIDDESLKELREAQKNLEKKIQDKVNAFYKAKRQIEQDKMITELKTLPIGAKVYYVGRYETDKIKFGTELFKRVDGRTKMHLAFDMDKSYLRYITCPYTLLREQRPTEQEYKDHKLGKELSRIFSNAINVK